MKESFSSLRIRNFRLFFFGQLVSNTGNWLTNVTIILLVIKLSHSGSGLAVGALAACSYGPILLLTAWAGSIVDTVDKRKFLMVTQSLEMLQSFSLAAVAFMHRPPLLAVYGLAIIGGICLSFDNPLRRSFVSETVPAEEVPNAVTLYSLIVNGARVVGPALAGALVLAIGYGWCFTIDALSYTVVITNIIRMRPAELYMQKLATKTTSTVRAGLRYIKSSPTLLIIFGLLLFIGLFSYNFTVTLPLFVTHGLRAGTATFTTMYAIFSIGSVVGALFIAKRQLTELRHVIIGAVSLGISMIVLSFAPNVTLALIVSFFVGLSSLLYITATTTLMQVTSQRQMLGRVLALQSVLMFGTTPIGGPLLGELSDLKGGRAPVLLGGIVALAAGLVGLYAKRRFIAPVYPVSPSSISTDE